MALPERPSHPPRGVAEPSPRRREARDEGSGAPRLPQAPTPGNPAAVALVEADVWPMGPGSPGRPGWLDRAEAILWVGDTIRLVGSNAEVREEAGRLGIRPIAMAGRTVLPGFVDAHTHFLHVGVKTTRPDLRGATSLREALARLASWLAAHPGSGPVIAEGWDESGWSDRRRPTRQDVDGVVAAAAKVGDGPLDRPVVLRRICGHVAVASSGALPLVRARWDDDAAVNVDTGLLLEAPSLYLNEVLPSTPEQLDRAVQEACREAHRLGVTAVGDYSQAPYRAALQRAAAAGTLPVRTFSSIYVQQLEAELATGFRTGRPALGPQDIGGAATARRPGTTAPTFPGPAGTHWGPVPGTAGGDRTQGGSSPWMRDGGLKVFLDGSLGAHTAHLRQAYRDAEGAAGVAHPHGAHAHGRADPGVAAGHGARIWTDEEVDHHFGTAHAAGVQIHAHAIGDAAIDQGLDAFERLAARDDLEGHGWVAARLQQSREGPLSDESAAGGGGLRHRFEHFEIVHEDQVRRAAALGIVASSQPNFVGEWSAKGGMYEARLGPRYQLNNRFVAFKEAGIPLAFGSDGMPFGPLVGIASAVRHPDALQRLTVPEAVWHYTRASAWAIHWEDAIGTLAPGLKADLVVLPAAWENQDPQMWMVEATVAGGALLHGRLPP